MDVVDIYNEALGKVGTRTTVSATTEGSNEANSCNVFYTGSRDAVLRAIRWNFARKQKLLTQLKSSADIPNTCPSPWAYEYAYPSDCLKARYILPQFSAASTLDGVPIDSSVSSATPITVMGPPIKYIIGVDDDSNGNPVRVILTNQYQAQLVYTFRAENVNLFDPEFVECLACVLAANIGPNLTGDKALRKQLRDEAITALRLAAVSNGNEGLEINNPMPDWIRARGYNQESQPLGFSDFDSVFNVA